MKILDNTILSNFAYVKQLELLAVVLPDAVTTPQVMDELRQGEATKRLPVSNWQWLTVVSLTFSVVVAATECLTEF